MGKKQKDKKTKNKKNVTILVQKDKKSPKERGIPGFEPGTTRTLSEYHTPRPNPRTWCYACLIYGIDKYDEWLL